jgi:hypothetical protein
MPFIMVNSMATLMRGNGSDRYKTADLLHAMQGTGGGDILGHQDLEQIINNIMISLTGDVSP